MIIGKIINYNGVPMYTPNDITVEKEDFYISYNNTDTYIYGCGTTALVKGNGENFLILNGNHTEQYNAIVNNGGNYSECLKYYHNHINEKSKYSEDGWVWKDE